MKGLIIYKGRYGATKQYAEWLSDALQLPVMSAKDAGSNIDAYDYLIIGSSVYIGKLEIRSWLKKRMPALLEKKIFFFQVSGTPPDQTKKIETYLDSAFTPEEKQKIEAFFLPGQLDISRLSWLDRFVLRMGARLAKDPGDRSNMLTEYNHVKAVNLEGLINRVKEYTHQSIATTNA